MRFLPLVMLLVLASSCTTQAGEASTFKAGSDAAARDVVTLLLDAAKAKKGAEVERHLCDRGAGARFAAALQDQLEGWEIKAIEGAWLGAEPYFRVDVALKKGTRTEERSLSVRAREGCVDRLLGEPVAPAQLPEAGEISL